MANFTDFLTRDFFNANPAAAIRNVFSRSGGTDPYAQFLRNSQSRLYDSYLERLPTAPNLDFVNFLRTQDMDREFRMLDPRQKGQSIFAPRVRFLGF